MVRIAFRFKIKIKKIKRIENFFFSRATDTWKKMR